MKILTDVLMPWITKYYDPQRIMFVQDSASAHGSKIVQKYLMVNLPLFFPKDKWPSSSLDLMSMFIECRVSLNTSLTLLPITALGH